MRFPKQPEKLDLTKVSVKQVPWATHAEPLGIIRRKVFVEEQQVPEELEWDEADADAWHWLATDDDGALLGCARLQQDGKIGRMAVEASHRGAGVGMRILQSALEFAKGQFDTVYLYAQTSAIPFYERAGFVATGPEFMEADIPHRKMLLRFESSGFRFSSHDEAREALRLLIAEARLSLRLHVPLMAAPLLDDRELIETLSEFARSRRECSVRILIHDSGVARRSGHRLIPLIQRLTSKIELRRLPDDKQDRTDNFVISDERALLYQELHSRADGEYLSRTHDKGPLNARRYGKQFDELWELAQPDPSLRRLHI
ncbi:MAG: GNAT family N-acetyltransferase [Gammaproteobacteria bacterium]